MRISLRSVLRGLVALALTVVLFVAVRAELAMEHRSSGWLLTQMATGLRAEADFYCDEHQADGCGWPDDSDEDNARIAARNE
ncbi:MAG: hypothetical protein ABSH33_22130 [Steroidobacteraceae bacterium]|jgi:hypothetical protein